MDDLINNQVTSEQELRNIMDYPSEVVARKEINLLDSHCRDFIAKSPFLMIATSDKAGSCDISPRGDAPGFVRILDNYHMIIPERPGNRRVDSMMNIISNPNISLIFLIPGMEETLRIIGQACVTRDPDLLDQMKVNDKAPVIAIAVKIERCFVHCAKAFKRSKLWHPEAWLEKEDMPNAAQMLAAHINMAEVDEQEVKKLLHESYTERLY